MTLTPIEISLLKAARDNEFENAIEGGSPWVFAVIEHSGLNAKKARGGLASLVQKGLAEISDYVGKRRSDDMVLTMTEQGIKVALEALASDEQAQEATES